MMKRLRSPAFAGVATAALLLLLPAVAHAGLFDDDEARKSIKLLGEKVDAQNKENETRFLKLDESIKGLGIIQLLNQIEALNSEIARLRGQIEVLGNQNEQLQKRQKDFYFDIDARLRTLEGGAAPSASSSGAAAAASLPLTTSATLSSPSSVAPVNGASTSPTAASPATAVVPGPVEAAARELRERERENRTYDVGSAAFRRGDFTAAMRAFQTFIADFPQSQLVPNAIYWVGLAQFNLKEFREARSTQESLLKRYPDSGKAPDAMLVVASAQAEMGDTGSARNTYEDIIAKHPMSDAAAKARTRLSGIRR